MMRCMGSFKLVYSNFLRGNRGHSSTGMWPMSLDFIRATDRKELADRSFHLEMGAKSCQARFLVHLVFHREI